MLKAAIYAGQNTPPLSTSLAVVLAAESVIATVLPDPDSLPFRTIATIGGFALLGWAAVSLHTLAKLMEGELEASLLVIQGMLASIAAGTMTFFGLYYLMEVPKMGAYIGDFLAAFGGAKYIDDIKNIFIGVLQGALNRTKGQEK